MSGPRTIVVGCGAVGAFCAWWLREAGAEVSMIDAGTFGGGCSAGNCGLICPSHVLPLALPGAVRAAIPTILRKDSPLRVRPSLEPALWSWLWRFARCCRWDRAWRTAAALHPLLQESRRQYQQLAEDLEFEFEARGCLFVHQHREGFEGFRAIGESLRDRFGLVLTPIEAEALVQREPALVDGLAGAWCFEDDAHLRPERLMSALRSDLEARGVEILERRPATGIAEQGRRAVALQTSSGSLSADAFVFATGAWTPQLARMLKQRLPIVPGKGYSLTSATPEGAPRTPIIFEDARVAVTPMRSGYRLGSTMEFAGYDDSLPEARLELLRKAARRFLRTPYQPSVEERWFGWRPMTPDGLPFIDRLQRWSNVFVATGHSMIGMATAPATGRLMADLVRGAAPWTDPGPYGLVGRV